MMPNMNIRFDVKLMFNGMEFGQENLVILGSVVEKGSSLVWLRMLFENRGYMVKRR